MSHGKSEKRVKGKEREKSEKCKRARNVKATRPHYEVASEADEEEKMRQERNETEDGIYNVHIVSLGMTLWSG
ncbi:hypothetical protein N7535_008483 [Penicillium sp. DV-2018c]|nr:hypothetical protein N7461_002241 [Penicillium sp. DV-2018c]KAJ5563319.1 hypothetical protein N7535_008483 [Penicillium sp. DV-2018c]